jgi:hypothetical protein
MSTAAADLTVHVVLRRNACMASATTYCLVTHLTNQSTHHQKHQPKLAGEHGCYLDEDGEVDRIKIVCRDTAKAQVTTARYEVATRAICGHCGDNMCMSSTPPYPSRLHQVFLKPCIQPQIVTILTCDLCQRSVANQLDQCGQGKAEQRPLCDGCPEEQQPECNVECLHRNNV